MKVTLAGYNVDKKILEKLPEEIIATPETISAAYAPPFQPSHRFWHEPSFRGRTRLLQF